MTLLIWILALFFMGFWTLFAWLTHKLLLWVGRLPWDQTLQQAKDLPVPAFVAPWWQQAVDLLAPVLEISQGLLAGLVQFAGATLPFVIGAIWLFDLLFIAGLAATGSAAVVWFRRKNSANARR